MQKEEMLFKRTKQARRLSPFKQKKEYLKSKYSIESTYVWIELSFDTIQIQQMELVPYQAFSNGEVKEE
ncbi:MAG: hypothetical protein QXO76_01935 [Thermoproteota archaeon]